MAQKHPDDHCALEKAVLRPTKWLFYMQNWADNVDVDTGP